MKLVGPQLAPHFVQFNTARSVAKALTFHQRVGLVESSAIRELKAQVMAHRDKLNQYFREVDVNDTGMYSRYSNSLFILFNLNYNMKQFIESYPPYF